MKAMAITDFDKPLEMIDIEDPVPKSGEVVLSVLACGVCHTDVKVISGMMDRNRSVKLPLIPGHEILGIIESVGVGVEGWKPGDKALVYIYVGCDYCLACQSGYDAVCRNMRYQIGFNANGGYAEKVKAPARNLIRVSSVVPDEKMAIVPCAIGTAYHAVVDRAEVTAGDKVLVVGAGGIGIHTAQIVLWSGGHAILADIDEAKLALAREVGINETYNVSGHSELPASLRVNKVIEASGAIYDWKWLFDAMEERGILVLVGYSIDQKLTVEVMKLGGGELEVRGSRASTRANLMAAVNLVESGMIKPVVDSGYPLAEANDVLSKLSTNQLGSVRTVLIP